MTMMMMMMMMMMMTMIFWYVPAVTLSLYGPDMSYRRAVDDVRAITYMFMNT